MQISQYSYDEFISGVEACGWSKGGAASGGSECGCLADEKDGCYQSHCADDCIILLSYWSVTNESLTNNESLCYDNCSFTRGIEDDDRHFVGSVMSITSMKAQTPRKHVSCFIAMFHPDKNWRDVSIGEIIITIGKS